MMPAVNPQQMTSLSSPIMKPGLIQPLGPWTLIRCSGASSSLSGTR